MVRYIIIIFLLAIVSIVKGQNLAPNPNFEIMYSCPVLPYDFDIADWNQPNSSSADYFHSCADEITGVPTNYAGFQESNTGNAYVGIVTYSTADPGFREHTYAELDQPLIQACYKLTLVYSHADNMIQSTGLGIHVGEDLPSNFLALDPQLIIDDIDPMATTEWITIEEEFIANGGENYITVGGFYSNADITFIGVGFAYYYVDSIGLELAGIESPDINADLGPDLFLCPSDFPYTLESNLSGYNNVWSTNESGNSIIIDEPGIYTLRAYEGCEYGEDSIEIFEIPEPEFILEDIALCAGESIDVILDPALGTYQWNDGSTSTEYTISEAGEYTVLLTYDCGVLVQMIEVDILEEISIDYLSDTALCTSDLPLVLNLSELDDGYNQFSWSTGSNEFIVFIFEAGAYEVTISNDCYSGSASFAVELENMLPETIPFSDTLLCAGDEVYINTGLEDGSLLWQDGSMNSIYTVTEEGVYSFVAENSCGVETYQFTINEYEEVELELGADVSICPGDSVLLSSSLGELVWNNGAQVSEDIWIDEEGFVVAVYAGQCSELRDSIYVSLDGESPFIDLPDTIVLCLGDSLILQAGSSGSGVSYEWNTGEVEHEIVVFSGGMYQVEGINNCGSAIDSVFISEGDGIPPANIDAAYMICRGDSLLLEVEAGNADILWSTGSAESSILLMDEGDYMLSLTNSCKSDVIPFTISYIDTLLDFSLGTDLGLCQGDSMLLEGPAISGSYNWSTMETSESIVAYSPGEYFLDILGACNLQTDTIFIIDLGGIPDVNLGDDISFCEGDSVLLGFNDEGIESILWNTGSMEESIVVHEAGAYSVLVSNQCGINFDTIVVDYDLVPPQVDLGEDKDFCEGDSVLLDAGTLGTIVWNTGSQESSIYVDETGWYYATLNSSCGMSQDSIFVQSISGPDIDLGADFTICDQDSLLLSVSGDNVLWNTGSTENAIYAYGNNWYSVVVIEACGMDEDSVFAFGAIGPDAFSLGSDTTICAGDEVEIVLDVGSDELAIWYDGAVTDTKILSEEGVYWVDIINVCGVVRDSIGLAIQATISEFTFDPIESLCYGDTVVLDGYQDLADNYLWQDGSQESSFVVSQAGDYSVIVSDECNSFSSNITIEYIEQDEWYSNVEDVYTVCENEVIEVSIDHNDTHFIEWSDGNMDFERSLFSPGLYEFVLSDLCQDSVVGFEIIHESCVEDKIFIPNIFTPNDDGINDVFEIFIPTSWDVPQADFRVFSRWGEELYTGDVDALSWNGTFKGERLNPGVYVYWLKLTVELDGVLKTYDLSGDITIMR